jgi:hypothetical protein
VVDCSCPVEGGVREVFESMMVAMNRHVDPVPHWSGDLLLAARPQGKALTIAAPPRRKPQRRPIHRARQASSAAPTRRQSVGCVLGG